MGRPACWLASQIAAGERNGLRLRVYGENGSIDWQQEDPNRLRVKWLDGPEEIRHAAGSYLGADARAVTRLPGGHPEGYIEAFAVLYREFADAVDCVAGWEGESIAGDAAGDCGWACAECGLSSGRLRAIGLEVGLSFEEGVSEVR